MISIALLLAVLNLGTEAQAGLTKGSFAREGSLDQVIPPAIRARIDARKLEKELGMSLQATPDYSDLPTEVSLRNRDRAVTDQGSKPWCTIYGLASVMENMLGDGTDLSERDGWDNQGGKQSVQASQRWNERYGMVEEPYWPMGRRPARGYCSGRRLKPTDIKYIEDDVEAAIRHIAAGKPVYVGMSTPSSMLAKDPIIDPNRGTTGGGHAIAFVGYRLDSSVLGGGYFLVKNSWGEDTGDHGYQWLPIGTCAKRGFYCSMYTFGAVTLAPAAPWCSNGDSG